MDVHLCQRPSHRTNFDDLDGDLDGDLGINGNPDYNYKQMLAVSLLNAYLMSGICSGLQPPNHTAFVNTLVSCCLATPCHRIALLPYPGLGQVLSERNSGRVRKHSLKNFCSQLHPTVKWCFYSKLWKRKLRGTRLRSPADGQSFKLLVVCVGGCSPFVPIVSITPNCPDLNKTNTIQHNKMAT